MTVGNEALDVVLSINEIIIALALIGVGFVLCFWGGLFARKIIFLIGFFAGALFAYVCLNNLAPEASGNVYLLISCGVGLIVGCLCMWVYVSTVFILGAIAGVILAQLLWHGFVSHLVPSSIAYIDIIFVLVFAVACGIFAFVMEKLVMKVLTAFIGSFMIVSGVSFFVMKYIVKEDSANALEFRNFFNKTAITHNYDGMASFIAWVALFACGVWYQYKMYKLKPTSNKSKHDDVKDYEKLKQVHVNS